MVTSPDPARGPGRSVRPAASGASERPAGSAVSPSCPSSAGRFLTGKGSCYTVNDILVKKKKKNRRGAQCSPACVASSRGLGVLEPPLREPPLLLALAPQPLAWGPAALHFLGKPALPRFTVHGSRSQSAWWGPGPVVHLQEGGVSGSAHPQALQSPLHPLPPMPLVPAHLGRGHI